MVRQAKTRGAGSRLGRTETVSIRLDPRLNYLCELAARSQRRTKSSFIEATIDANIKSLSINEWRSDSEHDTFGARANDLWSVHESRRLIALGFIAPELMTFEEQQIWAAIRECGYFWKGRWNDGKWDWWCREESIVPEHVDEYWKTLLGIAEGIKSTSELPQIKKTENASKSASGFDDDIPF